MSRENQHYMTEAERYQLEAYLRTEKSISWIATQLNISRQTIYNEIKRGTNAEQHDYSAALGQSSADARSKNKGCPLKLDNDAPLLAYLEKKMLGVQDDGTIDTRKRYSPAAALAAAREDGLEVNISLSTLYNYIDQGVFPILRNSDLWEKIRRKPKKKKPTPKKVHKNLPSIEDRPKNIENRCELGHWEMDLIVGPITSRPCLLTLTERTIRFEIIIKLPNKKARTIRKVFNRLERKTPNFQEKFKSITTDNGSEFLEYEKLKKSVLHKGDRFKIYYCHSFASWEKGTNENHNRIIRRWFPKGTDFSKITEKEVQECQDWMNNYPRKILGWKSPIQKEAQWGPARLKPCGGAPFSMLSLSTLTKPTPVWFFYPVHIHLLCVLLELQNFLLRHHIALFHFMFKISHSCQRIIGLIILITHKPTRAEKGSNHLWRGSILKLPCVIRI